MINAKELKLTPKAVGSLFAVVAMIILLLGPLSWRHVIVRATEYLAVIFVTLAAGGYGRMLWSQFKQSGALSALGLLLSGVLLLAIGFCLLSVCLRPSHPFYLLASNRGKGAAVLILASAFYGSVREIHDNRVSINTDDAALRSRRRPQL